MTTAPHQMPLEEAVNNMRDNILRTQSQSNTASITAFDSMVEQLKIFAMQINDKNVEITRLQALCKKNNIDFAVPPEVKKPVQVAAPKSTTTKA